MVPISLYPIRGDDVMISKSQFASFGACRGPLAVTSVAPQPRKLPAKIKPTVALETLFKPRRNSMLRTVHAIDHAGNGLQGRSPGAHRTSLGCRGAPMSFARHSRSNSVKAQFAGASAATNVKKPK